MRALRYFRPGVYVAFLILGCALMASAGLAIVHHVHAASATKREGCGLMARALLMQKPILRHTVQHPDACEYLRRLKGEDA